MPFLTEKETESWLKSQTRDLPMPDGSMRPFTGSRILWETVDLLTLLTGYSCTQLVEFALEESAMNGVSFERAFPGVVGYLESRLRKP